MKKFLEVILAVVVLSALSAAQPIPGQSGEVIIIEIMYNPDSSESSPHPAEWVEIYNTTAAPIDLGGWTLQDEDGMTGPMPAGTMLAPGEAAVVIPDTIGVTEFEAAWGTGFQVIPVASWTSMNLANSPNATNEILSIAGPGAIFPADVVNYDDTAPWPSDSPDGPSIYLPCGVSLDAMTNDDGANWRRSDVGLHDARLNTVTTQYNGMDIGSPGQVFTSPITASSISLGAGCGGPVTLTVDPPVPNSTVGFSVTGMFPNAHTWIVMSAPPVAPYSDPISGCMVYVDVLNLANFFLLMEGYTDANGTFDTNLFLDAGAQNFLGATFIFQARVWAVGGPLFGDHLTNGVQVVIGC